ncbi:MAG: hypothetical protein ACFE9T_10330 [Promethearchaeota archaeon]
MKNAGEILFKSESSKINSKIIVYGGWFVLISLLEYLIYYLIISIINQYLIGIFFLLIAILILMIGFISLVLPHFQFFNPKLTVFEKGLRIRRKFFRIFPITKFIPIENIVHIEMKKKIHSFYSTRKIYIYVNGQNPKKIDRKWILNYEDLIILFLNLKNS